MKRAAAGNNRATNGNAGNGSSEGNATRRRVRRRTDAGAAVPLTPSERSRLAALTAPLRADAPCPPERDFEAFVAALDTAAPRPPADADALASLSLTGCAATAAAAGARSKLAGAAYKPGALTLVRLLRKATAGSLPSAESQTLWELVRQAAPGWLAAGTPAGDELRGWASHVDGAAWDRAITHGADMAALWAAGLPATVTIGAAAAQAAADMAVQPHFELQVPTAVGMVVQSAADRRAAVAPVIAAWLAAGGGCAAGDDARAAVMLLCVAAATPHFVAVAQRLRPCAPPHDQHVLAAAALGAALAPPADVAAAVEALRLVARGAPRLRPGLQLMVALGLPATRVPPAVVEELAPLLAGDSLELGDQLLRRAARVDGDWPLCAPWFAGASAEQRAEVVETLNSAVSQRGAPPPGLLGVVRELVQAGALRCGGAAADDVRVGTLLVFAAFTACGGDALAATLTAVAAAAAAAALDEWTRRRWGLSVWIGATFANQVGSAVRDALARPGDRALLVRCLLLAPVESHLEGVAPLVEALVVAAGVDANVAAGVASGDFAFVRTLPEYAAAAAAGPAGAAGAAAIAALVPRAHVTWAANHQVESVVWGKDPGEAVRQASTRRAGAERTLRARAAARGDGHVDAATRMVLAEARCRSARPTPSARARCATTRAWACSRRTGTASRARAPAARAARRAPRASTASRATPRCRRAGRRSACRTAAAGWGCTPRTWCAPCPRRASPPCWRRRPPTCAPTATRWRRCCATSPRRATRTATPCRRARRRPPTAGRATRWACAPSAWRRWARARRAACTGGTTRARPASWCRRWCASTIPWAPARRGSRASSAAGRRSTTRTSA
jgi:hypothetical protein